MSSRDFEIRNLRFTECELECIAFVSPDLDYFQGHFTDQPILPGVAQISALIVSRTRSAWPELGRVCQLGRIKFHKLIVPGDQLAVHLTRSKPETVAFTVRRGDDVCSSGNITFDIEAS